jgi:GH15 family glucan-1,4-alpha-glucosidase
VRWRWTRPLRALYLPIAEHGLIGDLHTVALVGTDGTIDWYCCPRFDSPSVFAAILDADHGGAGHTRPTFVFKRDKKQPVGVAAHGQVDSGAGPGLGGRPAGPADPVPGPGCLRT